MHRPDFTNIAYLKNGTATQQKVYDVLTSFGILNKLAAYQPLLVGTFPLDIQTVQSDIDIICYCQNTTELRHNLHSLFSAEPGFTIRQINHLDHPAIVVNFFHNGFPFEIFGQSIPTAQQNGYRHMLIEHDILMHFGDDFRQKIIALKESGIKTEPAFCKLLGIPGDPYSGLLEYSI